MKPTTTITELVWSEEVRRPTITAGEAREWIRRSNLLGRARLNSSITRLDMANALLGLISVYQDEDPIPYLAYQRIRGEFGEAGR